MEDFIEQLSERFMKSISDFNLIDRKNGIIKISDIEKLMQYTIDIIKILNLNEIKTEISYEDKICQCECPTGREVDENWHQVCTTCGLPTCLPTVDETTQTSGLTDYELELDKICDKIKSTNSSLESIKILQKFTDKIKNSLE